MPPTLYLIDGHALAYRMYFALTAVGGSQRWQTSKGEPTAGIYGFARELLRIIEQEQPEYLAVAFDVGKTFRDELFPAYKGTREKMPDDLSPQIKRIRQLVDVFNIPRLEMEGYEADDVLGSVARIAAEQGLGVKIVTGDRDLLQLVNKRTVVYLAGDDQNYIKDEDVVKKLGVLPRQVVDYKALVGDKSDNIPGVAGIGEKTAIALIEKYGTLDNIYGHIDEIENRWKTKLEANKANAFLSRDLAQIKTDLVIKLDLRQVKAQELDIASIEAFFKELEFRSLIKTLEKLTGQPASDSPAITSALAAPTALKPGQQMSMFANESPVIVAARIASNITVNIVDTDKKLAELVKALNKARVISFDTETTSTEEMRADMVGISLAVKEGEGYYIPTAHAAGKNLPLKQVVEALKGPLTNPKIGKIAHNAKYDYIVLAKHGLHVSPLTFDTMLAEFIIDPSSRNLGLKNLAFAKLGEEMTHIEELIGKGKKQISMAEVAIASAAPYAVADAETTLRLMPIQIQELQRVHGEKLLEEIDLPLTPVLAEMEMEGVLIDLPLFEELSKDLGTRLAALEKQVYESAGKNFNLNSPQQVSEVLFDHLHLTPIGRRTVTGFYSTAAGILEEMRKQHSVVELMLNYRELSKLKFTYVDALPPSVDSRTGRVHTSYSQTGAVTGRISSNNPNLQQIPIRTEEGRRIRNGFVAGKGKVLLSVDYSQIELRIVAHMAQDETMLAAFRADEDIHATTARAIYGLGPEAVTKNMRRHAKAINFGLIYGMSPFGLTRTTDLTLAEAENFVRTYFEKFPGIKKYLDGIRRLAAQQGYVETLLGRRRYFPALQSKQNVQVKNREEREAINAPIQGTAADIMKLAMLKIPPALKKAKLNAKMLLQVHDELVLECPRKELEETARVVKEAMASAYKLDIPLSTDARYGDNWGEMKPI